MARIHARLPWLVLCFAVTLFIASASASTSASAAASAGGAAASPRGAVSLFHDSFESASDCAWSSASTPVAPAIGEGQLSDAIAPGAGAMAGSCTGPDGERVYAFTPGFAGTLHVTLDSLADLGFYVLDACPAGNELACVDDVAGGGSEIGSVALAGTSTVYLVVDSREGGADFTLDLAMSACGNNVVEPGEVCDGLDLNGHTCVDLGFSGGILACQPDCLSFDVSGCIP